MGGGAQQVQQEPHFKINTETYDVKTKIKFASDLIRAGKNTEAQAILEELINNGDISLDYGEDDAGRPGEH